MASSYESALHRYPTTPDQYRNLQRTITEIIADCANVDQAISEIIQSICFHTDWDFGEAWDFDISSQVLVHRVDWLPPSARFPKFQEISRQITFPPGLGLPGRVWKTVQPLWIPDVVEDTNFPRASFAARDGLHTGVGLPLRTREKVIGVMSFFSRTTRPPDNELLTLFEMVGQQIGLFIERQLLHQLERDQIQRKAALQERQIIAEKLRNVAFDRLFLSAISAETLPYLWESDQNKLWYALSDIRQNIQQTLAESQTLLTQLHVAPVQDLKPDQFLVPLFDSYAAEMRNRISLNVYGDHPLPAKIQVAIYCIAREALQNTMQYAHATAITISLSSHEFGGELTITDNGKGFDPNRVLPDRLGLRIMRGCAEGIAGTLEVVTALNQGTKIVLSWRSSQ